MAEPARLGLGVSLALDRYRPDPGALRRLAQAADALGFDVLWVNEAFGADAVSVAAWLLAHTERIDVGTAVMQIPARAPTATAMSAATLDVLGDGRFRLGLGVSGPVVSEGWYGVPFAQPVARTREYVEVVRAAWTRRPVQHTGQHHELPLSGGQGVPLRLDLRTRRASPPLYLGAMGPRNLELSGEVADGTLVLFTRVDDVAEIRAHLGRGAAAADRDPTVHDLTVVVPVAVGDLLDDCVDQVRPHLARYLGGMGSTTTNYYAERVARFGYADQVARVQELFRDGDPGAYKAVPRELVDDIALVGPADRVAARIADYARAGVRSLSLSLHGRSIEDDLDTLRTVAALRPGG